MCGDSLLSAKPHGRKVKRGTVEAIPGIKNHMLKVLMKMPVSSGGYRTSAENIGNRIFPKEMMIALYFFFFLVSLPSK